MKRVLCAVSVLVLCALALPAGAITISWVGDSGAHLFNYNPTTGVATAVTLGLGLQASDDIDAVSLGDDPYCNEDPNGDRRDVFCVGPAPPTQGSDGELINQVTLSQAVDKDVYRETPAAAKNVIATDSGVSLNDLPGLEASIDALDFTDVPATEGKWIYFSLKKGSPTLTAKGWSAADVLAVQAGQPGTLKRYAVAGTDMPVPDIDPVNDDLDGLSIRDATDDGTYDGTTPRDMLIFSLKHGQATDASIFWHYGAQDDGVPGPAGTAHTNSQFGMHSDDEVTAVEHRIYTDSHQEGGDPDPGTVPTLSEWGAILLALVLGGFAASTAMRRKRAQVA